MNTSAARCPKCRAEIPAGSPTGLCPRCLLQQAMHPTVILNDPPPVPPDEDIVQTFPQFQILQLIGAGGMGRVYKVKQPHLDRVAALKILPRELAADPAFAERFTREGRALARLSHPNIVGVFDFGHSGEYYWLLMEFVDGVNLRQAMHAGAMQPREALQIIPHICAALEYAHGQGVLHRDIKPENILIDTAGRVKIADFGIAKFSGEPGAHITLTRSGAALGTPAYMAPEQIERPQDVDHRADIYSLGVVFYEMLTGELPLGRFPAPSETSGVDPRLDNVVFRTLEKQRERRYQSAGEMKTQVENLASAPPLAPAPAVTAPVPSSPPPARTSKKAVWGFVLTVTGLLIGSAGMLFVTTRQFDTRQHYMAADRQMRPPVTTGFESLPLNNIRGELDLLLSDQLSEEEFRRRIGDTGQFREWFPTYPPQPGRELSGHNAETPEQFKERMRQWRDSLQKTPGLITPPPPPSGSQFR